LPLVGGWDLQIPQTMEMPAIICLQFYTLNIVTKMTGMIKVIVQND